MDTVNTSPLLSLSRAELAQRLGRADAPLVLDVRRPPRFAAGERIVATARHVPPDAVAAFAAANQPREVVVYCVYGHEVGREAAVVLARGGWRATWLAGGIEGGEDGVDDPGAIRAWRAQPLPTIRKVPALGVTGGRPSRWITRERPKIDRVACPWLIRRFIDPAAEFFYVPAERVLPEAQRLGAVAFDTDGGPIAHEWERCSFDALLHAFDLQLPALDRLATIVRGADTDRLDLAPQSAGLLATSLGLSRVHAADDHAMLAAAMPVYDALYAWCLGEASGQRPLATHAVPA